MNKSTNHCLYLFTMRNNMLAYELKPGDLFKIYRSTNDNVKVLTSRTRPAIHIQRNYVTWFDPTNFSIGEIYDTQEVIKIDPKDLVPKWELSANIGKNAGTLKKGDRFKHKFSSEEWIVVDTSPQFQVECVSLNTGQRTFCGKAVEVEKPKAKTFGQREPSEKFQVLAFGEWRSGTKPSTNSLNGIFHCDSGDRLYVFSNTETKDL